MQGLVHQINRKPEIQGQRGLPKLAVDSAHITHQGVEGDFNRKEIPTACCGWVKTI